VTKSREQALTQRPEEAHLGDVGVELDIHLSHNEGHEIDYQATLLTQTLGALVLWFFQSGTQD